MPHRHKIERAGTRFVNASSVDVHRRAVHEPAVIDPWRRSTSDRRRPTRRGVRPTIPGQVFAAFVALLLTFGAVSSYTVWQVRDLGRRLARIHGTLLPLPAVIAEAKSDLRGLDLVVDQPDPTALRRSVHIARRVRPYLDRLAGAFLEARRLLDDPDAPPDLVALRARLDALDTERVAVQTAANRFFDLIESSDTVDSGHDIEPARLAVRARVRDLGRALASFEIDLSHVADRAVASFAAEENRVVWGAIVLAAVAMVIGVAIAFGANRILKPLRPLRAGVERIARGEYDEPVVLEGASGELAALASDFNRMLAAIRRRDEQLSAQRRELVNRERLAAVGRMSAQITHELRNPLSSIGLNSELLMEELEDRGGARSLLENIIKEVERLREITEEYLRFARLPRPEPVPVDLNHAAAELLEFVRSELERADVRARVDADRAARPALVDPNQIRAALLNLVRNAREALEAQGGGHVVLKVRSLGEHATVEVIDDGPGMSDEALERLYEPFFSTKPQGTGLGLSLVKRIVEIQGGRVDVESAPARGTTVRLVLPLAEEVAT